MATGFEFVQEKMDELVKDVSPGAIEGIACGRVLVIEVSLIFIWMCSLSSLLVLQDL